MQLQSIQFGGRFPVSISGSEIRFVGKKPGTIDERLVNDRVQILSVQQGIASTLRESGFLDVAVQLNPPDRFTVEGRVIVGDKGLALVTGSDLRLHRLLRFVSSYSAQKSRITHISAH